MIMGILLIFLAACLLLTAASNSRQARRVLAFVTIFLLFLGISMIGNSRFGGDVGVAVIVGVFVMLAGVILSGKADRMLW